MTSKDIAGNELKQKAKSRVCPKCGGKLTIKNITENSCFTNHKDATAPWIVCKDCCVTTLGIDKEVFELSRKLVMDFGFKYYTHLNPVDDGEDYCIKANTEGAAQLAYWILKERDAAALEARIDELKRLWNTTQPDTIPAGTKALDMSSELHRRIAELKAQQEVSK